MEATTLAAKRIRTQWAAQFLAASELARRGYTVAFTMGNYTPIADMMVGTPNRERQFWVDVKGLSSEAFWLVKPKPPQADLYYILVCLAPLVENGSQRKPDQFFILPQKEVNRLILGGQEKPPERGAGFRFADARPFSGKWDALPR